MARYVYKKPRPPRSILDTILRAVLLALGVLAVAAAAVVVFFLLQPAAQQPPAAQPVAYQPPEKHTLDTRPTLVLDPGHGGNDPGALDATETVHEADINMEMAQRLAGLLQLHEAELRVVFTHTGGSFCPVALRASTAQQEEADLFVSLHLNSDRSAAVRGFQVFAPPPGWLYHTPSARAARLVADEVAKTDLPLMGTDGLFYNVYTRNAAGVYVQEVLDAAWYEQLEPRKGDTFGVLEYAGCPAILVEQWYISNEEDMALCNTPEGQQRMAECLYRALCAYFALTPAI